MTELSPLLIGTAIFCGYFSESVFGFAGTIIWLSFLSFFGDIKPLIFLTVFANICANSFVLLSAPKYFSGKHFRKMALHALPGLIIGASLVQFLSSPVLLGVFAVFLIFFALYSFWKKPIRLFLWAQRLMLFCAGVMQGVFGTGGPFLLIAMQSEFTHKSQIRSTLAAFFLTFNSWRALQYSVQGNFAISDYLRFWWLAPVIFGAVWCGYRVHITISEKIFRQGIAVLLFISGIFLLLK